MLFSLFLQYLQGNVSQNFDVDHFLAKIATKKNGPQIFATSKFTKGEDSQFMANRWAASTHVCSLKRAQILTRITSLP